MRTHYDMYRDREVTLRTPLTPPRRLGSRKLHPLHLFAIVCHEGRDDSGHYTAYIADRSGKRDVWWYYDDMKRGMRQIGSYENLLVSRPSVERTGTLYMYSML